MRIAITGTGAVTPIATDEPSQWDALLGGRCGIRPAPWSATVLDGVSLFAGVDDRFDPSAGLDDRLLSGTDTFVSFGLTACDEAMRRAGLGGHEDHRLDELRTAVVDGTSMGGMYSLMHAQWMNDTHGPDAIPPKTMMKIWSNMTSAQICMRYGLHGPSHTVTTACASALDAVGQAAGLIRAGTVDVALCGGTEGGFPVGRDGVEGFRPVTSIAGAMLGMETAEQDPARAMLPFDVARSGIVFGEGAAWFVLESEAHARARGAEPLAWLRGYGTCADAHHPSSPEPSGRWEARAMQLALDDAELPADAVDVLVAHATATPKGDSAEIRAIDTVHGRSDLLVTSIKGHTGHTGASSGGMGMLAAVRALRDGVVPHTLGTSQVDPAVDFDLVLGEPRSAASQVAQVNAFGFGGQDASVVLSNGR
jgi:3-oxoacyl-[acyl-carrier-protein] synthase II